MTKHRSSHFALVLLFMHPRETALFGEQFWFILANTMPLGYVGLKDRVFVGETVTHAFTLVAHML